MRSRSDVDGASRRYDRRETSSACCWFSRVYRWKHLLVQAQSTAVCTASSHRSDKLNLICRVLHREALSLRLAGRRDRGSSLEQIAMTDHRVDMHAERVQ